MSAGRPPRRAKRLDYVHFADWLKRNLGRSFIQYPRSCVLAVYANEHCRCGAEAHLYSDGKVIFRLGARRRWICYSLTSEQAMVADALLDTLPDEYSGHDVALALKLAEVAAHTSFKGREFVRGEWSV